MSHDSTDNMMPPSQEGETDRPDAHQEAGQKKPFVPPALTRHEWLPEVTAQFFGTFVV